MSRGSLLFALILIEIMSQKPRYIKSLLLDQQIILMSFVSYFYWNICSNKPFLHLWNSLLMFPRKISPGFDSGLLQSVYLQLSGVLNHIYFLSGAFDNFHFQIVKFLEARTWHYQMFPVLWHHKQWQLLILLCSRHGWLYENVPDQLCPISKFWKRIILITSA